MKLKLLNSVILFFVLAATAIASAPVEKTGMKNFADWNADNTGKSDVTDKLQQAIDWCIANDKTLYIPPGKYLVSNTLHGSSQPEKECGDHSGKGSLNIYGDAFNRPVIVLANEAPNFNSADISMAKPILEIVKIVPSTGKEREACSFYATIRNLNFDLGSGNEGAAAIRFPAAQDTDLSNIKIYANDTFAAGLIGIPGRNSPTVNIEIIGGKYGVYLTNSLGANIFGIKCANQSVAALRLSVWRGMHISGLEVSGCQGHAVITEGQSSPYQGNLVITDAKIELKNPEFAAFNMTDRALVLHNVFVRGTNKIVQSVTENWAVEAPNWTKINTFSYTPATISGATAYNLINGQKEIAKPIKDFGYTNVAPDNFILKTIPGQLLAFNHPQAVSVTDFGAVPDDGADDLPAFQKAIDQYPIVFVPAGKYHFNGTLTLRNNSAIFGDPGKRSELKPIHKPTERCWMIETMDGIGNAAIQDLFFDTPDADFYGAIRWRISNGFIYNVRNYMSAGHSERNKHNYEFTGHAGGCFYGISEHNNILSSKLPDQNFRKVYIEGTSNPISFYGLNLERGGDFRNILQYPFFEAVNSANIRVYGAKTETDGTVYRFSNCKNIAVTAVMCTDHPSVPPIIVLENGTTDVELSMFYCPDNGNKRLMIDDEAGDVAKREEFIGLYRVGNFDLSKFEPATPTSSHEFRHIDKLYFSIYPNPAKGKCIIETSMTGNPEVIISDLVGRIHFRDKISTFQTRIDTSGFPNGMYLITVRYDDKLATKKLNVHRSNFITNQ